MNDEANEAHFSETLPLAVRASDTFNLGRTQCQQLLASHDGTPWERILAGHLLAGSGDERVPRIPALVDVPGGVLQMGTRIEDVDAVTAQWAHVGVERDWIEKEAPRHQVDVPSFRLGRYPVTNFQYACFLSESGYQPRPSTWLLGAYPWDRSNHPVAGVSLVDAEEYCRWLQVAAADDRFRLPTEQEWEFAARGTDEREYPWGDTFAPDAANTQEFGVFTTTPVGSFPAGRSWCDAWDLAGNVEELTSSTYRQYLGGRSVSDDLTEILGDYPVTRGGSFSRFGDLARCSRRHGPHPGRLYPCGFRVAAAPLR